MIFNQERNKYSLTRVEWVDKDYLKELELYKRTMDGLIIALDFLGDSANINVGYFKKELKDIFNYSKEGYKMVNSCTDYRRGYEDAMDNKQAIEELKQIKQNHIDLNYRFRHLYDDYIIALDKAIASLEKTGK